MPRLQTWHKDGRAKQAEARFWTPVSLQHFEGRPGNGLTLIVRILCAPLHHCSPATRVFPPWSHTRTQTTSLALSLRYASWVWRFGN